MPLRREPGLVGATVLLGAATLVVPLLVGGADLTLSTIAFFAAAALVAEHFQVAGDEHGLDPAEGRTFSFSSAIHLAAAVVAGPWVAALTAAFGVVVADRLRGAAMRPVAFNASVFALAAFAAGHVFLFLGGSTGALSLPGDLLPLAGLAAIYAGTNTLLVELVVAASTASPVLRNLRHSTAVHLPTDAAEAGLGGALAFFVLSQPWAIVLLAPLGVAVYQAHARLVQLRRQTARALETFANVVDERDPYTHRHSERVATYVAELGERLGLPAVETARLQWAGRLHDLGKVAVDNSVLRKAGPLDDAEFEQMRRHARLSARILRRFEFAAGEAQAVEYHHERYDGHGYYGIERDRIPLASHFLAVADTFDAMTSDRPYRRALPDEVALREIEAKSGSQFHPAVAKAFVSLRRGRDPIEALTSAEAAELRGTSVRRQTRPSLRGFGGQRGTAVILAGCAVVLTGIGFAAPAAVVAGAAAVGGALAWRGASSHASRQLRRAFASASTRGHKDAAFAEVAEQAAGLAGACWAGLVTWDDLHTGGRIELERGQTGRPSEAGLVSWLLREHESADKVLVAGSAELGAADDAVHLAVPIYADGIPVAFFVLAFPKRIPSFALDALRSLPPEFRAAMRREPTSDPNGLAVAVGA